MRGLGKSFRRMAVLAAAAGTLAAPAPAAAQNGVDPTRFCVQGEVNAYLYNPYSVGAATALVANSTGCLTAFAGHVTNEEYQAQWRRCLLDGLAQSTPPLIVDPFLNAIYACTSTWLQFEVQVDPNPR